LAQVVLLVEALVAHEAEQLFVVQSLLVAVEVVSAAIIRIQIL
jgi:hypothetical protein